MSRPDLPPREVPNADVDLVTQSLPVSVLTGFLGSGKTTLLNYLIRQPTLTRTLVLINEFGEIGIDHDLVTRSSDEVVIEMASGCLCCTIRGDLAKTLREAPSRFARAGKPWFDRVVIETTGLADPAPIIHTLMSESTVAQRYHLDGVITTIDAFNGNGTLERQCESVKQASVADCLVITKSDLVSADTLKELEHRLANLNPSASRIVANKGAVEPELLFNLGIYDPKMKTPDVQRWLRAEALTELHDHRNEHVHTHNDVNRHDANIKATCLTVDEPIRGEAIDLWLDQELLPRGEDFLRTKGIINIDGLDGPLVIHGVQHIFHPPMILSEWPSDDRRTRIVFITRNVDESRLRNALIKLNAVEKRKPNPLSQNL